MINTRAELKLACLALLEQNAVEHPAGHQGKLAARYVIRSGEGERVGLMFEKSEASKPYLWVDRKVARNLMDADIELRVYLASSLYQSAEPDGKLRYGRHAALKSMRDLANADLVRFTIDRITQLQEILAHLIATS